MANHTSQKEIPEAKPQDSAQTTNSQQNSQQNTQPDPQAGEEEQSAVELVTFDQEPNDSSEPDSEQPSQAPAESDPPSDVPLHVNRQAQQPEQSEETQQADQPASTKQPDPKQAPAQPAAELSQHPAQNQNPQRAAARTAAHDSGADPYQAASEPARGVPVVEVLVSLDAKGQASVNPKDGDQNAPKNEQQPEPTLTEIVPEVHLEDLQDVSRQDAEDPLEMPAPSWVAAQAYAENANLQPPQVESGQPAEEYLAAQRQSPQPSELLRAAAHNARLAVAADAEAPQSQSEDELPEDPLDMKRQGPMLEAAHEKSIKVREAKEEQNADSENAPTPEQDKDQDYAKIPPQEGSEPHATTNQKSIAQPEAQAEAKTEAKTEAKPQAKAVTQSEQKSEKKSQAQPDESKQPGAGQIHGHVSIGDLPERKKPVVKQQDLPQTDPSEQTEQSHPQSQPQAKSSASEEESEESEQSPESEDEQQTERPKTPLTDKAKERALSQVRRDPHEVVSEIMKRIQDSRLGEDHELMTEADDDYQPSEDGAVRLADVMSKKVACVIDSVTVEQLAGLFNKRNISAVPIVHAQSKRFLGLVTMTDIFSRAFSEKMLASADVEADTEADEHADHETSLLQRPVKDFMDSEEPVTLGPDSSLQDACKLMVENQLHHLVITQNLQVKGIFSAYDALRFLAEHDCQPQNPA